MSCCVVWCRDLQGSAMFQVYIAREFFYTHQILHREGIVCSFRSWTGAKIIHLECQYNRVGDLTKKCFFKFEQGLEFPVVGDRPSGIPYQSRMGYCPGCLRLLGASVHLGTISCWAG